MVEEIRHITVNGRYKCQVERAAVKGVDGFKVEVNGDNLEDAAADARTLYDYAVRLTKPDAKLGEG